MIHDFRERLAWSEKQSDEPFWDAVYHKAFPDMLGSLLCSTSSKTPSQDRGVDRIIYLPSDRVIRIDEKKRGRNYNDFCLEYLSNDKTNAPGWMEKPLAIDFLAYAFMPNQRVYLLQWDLLRRAWMYYRVRWMAEYRHVTARNSGYLTKSLAVPIEVVQRAVTTAGIIDVQLDSTEYESNSVSTSTGAFDPNIVPEQGSLFEDNVA